MSTVLAHTMPASAQIMLFLAHTMPVQYLWHNYACFSTNYAFFGTHYACSVFRAQSMPVAAQIMLFWHTLSLCLFSMYGTHYACFCTNYAFLAHTVPFYVWQKLCLFLKAVLRSGHTRTFILLNTVLDISSPAVFKLSLLYQAGVQFADYLIIPKTTFVQTQPQNHNSLTFLKQLCGRISKIVTETSNYPAISHLQPCARLQAVLPLLNCEISFFL